MKPRSRITAQHAYAAVGILAMALLALLISVTRSGTAKLDGANRTLRERETTLATLQTRVRQLPKLEVRHQTLVKTLAVLEPAVSSGAYVPTLLRQMEGLAKDTGNTMMGLKPEPVLKVAVAPRPSENGQEAPAVSTQQVKARPERYERLPIELNIESNYQTLIALLQRLSTFPKMIAVNEMSLSPAAQSGRQARPSVHSFTGKLDLVALIQRQESKKWKSGAKS